MMFEFEQCLREFEAECVRLDEEARAFLGSDPNLPRFVLGKNEQARWCIRHGSVRGVVDDRAAPGDEWEGCAVIPANALPSGAIVVNCSTSIRPISAHSRLAAIDGVRVVAYADLVRASRSVPLPEFVTAFRADYLENRERWDFMLRRLNDLKSRQTVESIMRFRTTGDYRQMSGFSVRFDDQYFDPVVVLSPSEVFVDCGGFDGDTVLAFLSRQPNYCHIYMFEPSTDNFEKASRRLLGIPNLSLISLAVSDRPGTLSFDPGAGSASKVTSEGSLAIKAVSLDEYIAARLTYIKMDLEGWETKALAGTKGHIINDHPKLAISVYHDASDFWKIPELVLGLREDYDVYLRHYSEGWSETVMYFIPRDQRSLPLSTDSR